MADEREVAAEELRRIRDSVRDRALLGKPAALPVPRALNSPTAPHRETLPDAEPVPGRPDLAPVNSTWDTSAVSPRGGALGRFVRSWLAPLFVSQNAFNARQVQLDNALLSYVDERIDGARRHYDRALALHEERLSDVDERHLILEEELVAHIHDLVQRIDIVLAESEKGRLSLEASLRDVRNRLTQIEERLPRR